MNLGIVARLEPIKVYTILNPKYTPRTKDSFYFAYRVEWIENRQLVVYPVNEDGTLEEGEKFSSLKLALKHVAESILDDADCGDSSVSIQWPAGNGTRRATWETREAWDFEVREVK